MKDGRLVAIGGGTAGAAAVGVAGVGARGALGLFGGDAVAGWVENDESAGAFSGAGGLEAGVAEEEVKHSALAGVHGLEAEGLVSVFDLIDGRVGCVAYGAGAGGLVAVGIEGDAVVVIGLEVEHLGGDVFEGAEELAVGAEEEFCVGAFALDVDVAAFEAVGIYSSGSGGNTVLEAHAPGGGEEPHEDCNFFGS